MKIPSILRIMPLANWLALIALLALILVGFAYCSQREQRQQAEGRGDVAEAQGGLGSDALGRLDRKGEDDRQGRDLTDSNTDFIEGAENANDDAGEAGDRGRLAYCERQRVRGRREPDYCPELRRAYPS
jgi:hypothetical protein